MLLELRRAGFDPDWERVFTRQDYLSRLDPSLEVILADYQSAQIDASSALRLMQERGLDIPFIVVSATVGKDVVVSTLKEGASEYLLKDHLARLGQAVTRALEQKRLKLEKQRAEEEVHYQATLLRNIRDAVISTDMSLTIESWNEAAKEMYGWKAKETLGRPLADVILSGSAHQAFEDELQRLFESEHFEGRAIHVQKDGTALNVLASVSLLRDDEGSPVGAVMVSRDISDIKRVEERLRRALADAKRSNEELEQFAYVASHDLQEPLRQVVSYLQLIELRYKGKLDSEADEFIGFAVQGALRMQRMIEDWLTYSRAGARDTPRTPTDLSQVCDHVLADFCHAIEANGATVTRDALPKVDANEMVMEQLFRNLVGNALKFLGDEPPRIHIGAQRADKEWLFSVCDNGIGIDPIYFDRIFAIFDRLHTNQEYPGTGIGLALCKRIVHGYGGRIWVDSEPGLGSTFWFTMPDRDLEQGKQGASSGNHKQVMSKHLS